MSEDNELRDVLAADAGILKGFGITDVERGEGRCTLMATVPDELVNAAGFAHGGLLFALADTASAYAVGSVGSRGVTIDAHAHFVRGAKGGMQVRAIADVEKQTRQLVYVRARVEEPGQEASGEDVLLFSGSYTFMRRS